MNAIDFLIKEHNRVRILLVDISDESHHFETQKKKFDVLSKYLLRHETIEQKLWYPHFKNKLPDTVKHLVTEEKRAEKTIKELSTVKSEEAWKAQF